jgi:hypothetical protein
VALLPCGVSECLLGRRADVLPRFVVLASTAHGAGVRRRREAGLETMPSSAEMEGYLRTIVRTKFADSRRTLVLGVPSGSVSSRKTLTILGLAVSWFTWTK